MSKIQKQIHLESPNVNENAKNLSQLLADSYALYLRTQNYHWNVTGPLFYSLHLLFEAQHKDLAEAIDEIAERLRALGFRTPGSFEAFSELTSLEPEENPTDETGMLKALVQGHERVRDTAKQTERSAQEAGDSASQDLAIERIAFHDKAIWMLRSSLA